MCNEFEIQKQLNLYLFSKPIYSLNWNEFFFLIKDQSEQTVTYFGLKSVSRVFELFLPWSLTGGDMVGTSKQRQNIVKL